MANDEHVEILRRGVQVWNGRRRDNPLFSPALIEATLRWANFRGADFINATLWQPNLQGAELSRATLSEANLGWADLSEANLRGANLTSVQLGATTFANVQLSNVTGLASVVHRYPSTVGTDTLRLCQGKLPDEFLKGCGLADLEIEAARLYDPHLSKADRTSIMYKMVALQSQAPNQFHSCFISYSHANRQFARRLYDQLQERGIRCWLDEKELLPGDDIYKEVDRAIRQWDKVLLCCTEASLSSWWVEKEIDTAVEKERQLYEEYGEEKLALIPLNLDGHMFEWKGSHAAMLRKRLAADFTDWEQDDAKFEAQFERVVLALTDSE